MTLRAAHNVSDGVLQAMPRSDPHSSYAGSGITLRHALTYFLSVHSMEGEEQLEAAAEDGMAPEELGSREEDGSGHDLDGDDMAEGAAEDAD